MTTSSQLNRSRIAALASAAETESLGEAAALLAEAGVPVFPCVPGAKRPLAQHGFHDATTDPSQVERWWNQSPDANVGVPTGAVSGVVVVDVDVHPTSSGFPAFIRARSAGLVADWSLVVRTPSGGLHAYFLADSTGVQRSWQAPRQHIDFRGDGGYIVVPPSRVTDGSRPSRPYALIAVSPHAPRAVDAAGLRAFLDPPRPSAPRVPAPSHLGADPSRLVAWVASRPEGSRNHSLFWAACELARAGQSLGASLDLLGEAATTAGLTQHEAETTIRSAHRRVSRRHEPVVPRPPPHPGQDLHL